MLFKFGRIFGTYFVTKNGYTSLKFGGSLALWNNRQLADRALH